MKKPLRMTNKSLQCVKRRHKVFSKYKNKEHPAVRKAVKKAKRSFERKLAKI